MRRLADLDGVVGADAQEPLYFEVVGNGWQLAEKPVAGAPKPVKARRVA